MEETLSKTQAKRAQRKAEAEDFIHHRRMLILTEFQQRFDAGIQMYESIKDDLSEEEKATLEQEIENNLALIAQKRAEWEL